MTQPFLPYALQSINAADLHAVVDALSSSTITRGNHVDTFEQAVANYCNAQYAVAFNSGSTALLAACHAVGVSRNDRLLTSPNTFVADIAAGMHHGATPVFVDIDLNTGNLDLDQVENDLQSIQSSRGRTIVMPVHFSGTPVDMQRIDKMICNPDTIVIEDAAHALGSRYQDGQMVGCCAWSHMTVFSFHPAKTITTGEGGMVLTNDPDLYHRLRRFRNNGIERDPAYLEGELADIYEGYYEVVEITNNYNFTDFQAALGLSQLQRANEFISKRRELMQMYRELLEGLPDFRMLSSTMVENSACHLCVALIDFEAYGTTRKHVMQMLSDHGIGTQLHYRPLYRHPFFQNKIADISKYFPNMETYYAQALTLPLYYDLTEDDVKRITTTLKDILAEERKKMYSRKKKRPNHREPKMAKKALK